MGRKSGSFARRGGALLAVLWLTAALSAIAFSVAVTVRGEISRADTALDGLKASYLAKGAIERALLYLQIGPGPRLPDGTPRFWQPGMPLLRFAFPGGEALVEIIPESTKFNINRMSDVELLRLLTFLGVDPLQAQQLTAAILDWRAPNRQGQSPFDAFYLSQNPSFRAPHASLEQIEELLMVRGMTPDLFYGRYDRAPEGGLIPRNGLRDCVTVYGVPSAFDINTVTPEVMATVGVPPQIAEAVVNLRRIAPITNAQMPALAPQLGPAFSRFRIGGGPIYTLKATARLIRADGSLSDSRRSAAAVVWLKTTRDAEAYQVLRWYDAPAAERLNFEAWSR